MEDRGAWYQKNGFLYGPGVRRSRNVLGSAFPGGQTLHMWEAKLGHMDIVRLLWELVEIAPNTNVFYVVTDHDGETDHIYTQN